MKKGLVLEGGAMRGMFTCGVIDVMMENNINFDGLSGVSAGAIFGCNYKSRQIGRGLRYNKKYGKDPRYCSIWSLLTTGDLYGEKFCYHEVMDVLDPIDKKTFEENTIDFYIVATDIENAVPRYYNCKTINDKSVSWIRASASMPLVSNVVKIDDYKLLDGGITDSIPYRIMEENGYNRNVIVLTQDFNFIKKQTSLLPIIKIILRKYPKLVEAMAKRHIMYNKQIEEIKEKERKGEVLVIRPDVPLNISRTENNPNELERVYQIGRSIATKSIDKIKGFLS